MKKLIILACLLLASVAACAAPLTIVFTDFQAPTQQQPTAWLLGYPYTATIDGVTGLSVMCDDWAHGGGPGQTWQAYYTDLGTGNLTKLRFNQLPNAGTLYNEVGWLALQTTVQPYSQWEDINLAVWYTFDQSASPYMTPNAYSWIQKAQIEANLGFPGVNFHDVEIYTPVNQYGLAPNGNIDPGAAQELLRPVPEPATLSLLAGGLLAMLGRKLSR